MNEQQTPGSLAGQAQRLGSTLIDYAGSVFALLQARMAHYAISTVLFTILICFSSIFVLAAFTLVNIAFGVWLTNQLGSSLWALLILGALYGVLGVLLGSFALRWLFRLRS